MQLNNHTIGIHRT